MDMAVSRQVDDIHQEDYWPSSNSIELEECVSPIVRRRETGAQR